LVIGEILTEKRVSGEARLAGKAVTGGVTGCAGAATAGNAAGRAGAVGFGAAGLPAALATGLADLGSAGLDWAAEDFFSGIAKLG